MSELFVVTWYLEERGVAISQIHPLENLENNISISIVYRANPEMLALPNPFLKTKKYLCTKILKDLANGPVKVNQCFLLEEEVKWI